MNDNHPASALLCVRCRLLLSISARSRSRSLAAAPHGRRGLPRMQSTSKVTCAGVMSFRSSNPAAAFRQSDRSFFCDRRCDFWSFADHKHLSCILGRLQVAVLDFSGLEATKMPLRNNGLVLMDVRCGAASSGMPSRFGRNFQ